MRRHDLDDLKQQRLISARMAAGAAQSVGNGSLPFTAEE
jgi:hypothetical protein